MTGKRFGRLIVIERDELCNSKHATWKCRCDCGNITSVLGTNLRRGISNSCGCLQRELLSKRRKIHGGWANKEPLFNVWRGILQRCNPEIKSTSTKNYGQRGITVCDEWHEYAIFREWAIGAGYRKGLSIDRINVNEGYSPQNCRWADNKTQQNNKRNNVYVDFNKETHTLKEWSELLNINYQTVYSRYQRGLPIESVLSTSLLR